MMDIQDDEDEMFFTPQTSTNLATLFNNSLMKCTPDKQVSLVYKAPKQPNLSLDDSINNPLSTQIPMKQNKPQSSVICFKEVHSFKHMNDSIQTLGKCGLALIGNEEFKIYQLLIYKQKTNILSSSKVNELFEFCIQKNNHSSITDDKKVHWSIQFYTEQDMKDFASTLLEKCSCKIKNDDNINFLSESLKNITTNITSKITSDAKKQNDTPTENPPLSYMKGDGVNEAEVEDEKNEDNNNETLAIKKASILSKVAKMGQKVLTENSPPADNDPEGDMKNSDNMSHALMQKQLSQYASQISDTKTSMGNLYPNPMLLPQASLHSSTSTMPDALNLFFIENRIHNSEFRMNLMKLQTSVDSVLTTIKTAEDPSQKKIDEKLQSDNKKLQLILAKQKETMNTLKTSLELYRKRNEELMKSEAEHAIHLASLTEEAAKTACEDHKRNMNLKDLQVKNEDLNQKLSDYEKLLDTVQLQIKNCVFIKKTELEILQANIKDIMNNFFDQCCDSFRTDISYDANDIKKTLATITIDFTYKILHSIQQKCNESKITLE